MNGSASPGGSATPGSAGASSRAEGLTPTAEFLRAARAMGVDFAEGELDRLGRFLAMLLDENTRVNLTAIRDPEQAWERHVLDALTLLSVLAELPADARVLDLGSGGGVPGVPLAIVCPTTRFTLVDATAKKTAFLERVGADLGLGNLEVVTGRAESLAAVGSEMRGSFDAVLARAVGRLVTLAELAVPFAKVGGLCALVKGAKADEEVAEAKRALHLLHARHADTVSTPTGRIVVLEKLRDTPKAYPRRDGEPKKSPLGL